VWCTGQSGAPPDTHSSCPVHDCLPNKAQLTVAASGTMAHRTVRCTPDSPVHPADHWCGPRVARGLRGLPLHWRPLAHRTVRCTLPTVGAGHASPVDCEAYRCTGDRWLTGQSGAPPDSPLNYSRTPLLFSRERLFHRRPAWRTGLFTGDLPAPPDSPVCQTELRIGYIEPSLFPILFSLFLVLRQNMLVLKTMY
jgi:hypothetical protein